MTACACHECTLLRDARERVLDMDKQRLAAKHEYHAAVDEVVILKVALRRALKMVSDGWRDEPEYEEMLGLVGDS